MPFIHPEVEAVQAVEAALAEAEPAVEAKAEPAPKEPEKAAESAPAPAGEEQKKEAEAKVEAKPDTSLMARMLSKERARKAEVDKLRGEKEALEKERAELASLRAAKEKADRWEQFEAAREAGDYNRVLELIGTDLPRLNEAFMKGGRGEPDVKTQVAQLLRERDAAARAEQEKASKAAEAERARQEQEARTKIMEQVAKDEACELINAAGAQGEVWELMRATYEESGKLLPVAEAAKQVEEYLEAQLLKTKRLGSKLAPKTEPKEEKAPAGRTLSSSMAPSAAGERAAQTEDERKAEAIAWLRSQGMQ